MNKQKICCQICGKPLGFVDLDTLESPISSDQITSLMPERGIPAPFVAGLPFLMLYCRQCKSRAFHKPNEITLINDHGFKKLINIDKLNIEKKTRAANQALIDSFFEEDEETPTAIEKVKGLFVKSDGFECPKCRKLYQHQSSMLRHKKDCNG